MKIILSLHHFLPEVVGGTEIYTLRLAQHLKQVEIDAVVLIPNLGYSFTTEYEYRDIRVIKYAENSIEDRKMIMGKTKPEGLQEFADILIKEKPDAIHFHELAPGRGINIFHVEKVRELNIPIVLTFHLASYSCFKGSLILNNVKKCDGLIKIKRCTECVFQEKNITGVKAGLLSVASLILFNLGVNPTSLNNTIGTALGFPFVINKIKTDLLKFSTLAEKIIVLANWYKQILEKNGVPPEKLVYIKQGLTNEIPKPFNNDKISYPLKIVYIGRISPMKGLHLLIDAVAKLSEEKISLHIHGPEREGDYSMKCKQKSAFKKNIHWRGIIPSEHVIETLSNYHVLCLPSAFEMSPLVIQEAFAAGLPVIASDVYGNAEQIKEGINGWLFSFKNSDLLTAKLNYLIENLNEVETARLHLPSTKMFKEIAAEHLKLYSEIITLQKKPR